MINKIYLDSSCLSNEYLLEYLKNTKAQFYISELTLFELKSLEVYKKISKEKIDELLKVLTILKTNEKILRLAKAYIDWDCISKEEYYDALHIAIAKYYKCSTIIYDKDTLKKKKINYSRMQCRAQ